MKGALKISIDLLPQEFKTEELKRTKFYKIQTIGVAIILILAFLASSTVALRILQTQRILQIKESLAQTELRVSDLKDTESSLVLLKNRLGSINAYLGNPSMGSQMYSLIDKLLPESISISSISIGSSGEVLISAIASDGASIDILIDNLTDAEKTQDRISEVVLETLTRGRDGIYRLSLKVKPKT